MKFDSQSFLARAVLLCGSILFASNAWAALITVNSSLDMTADDGNCTLREAIDAANNDMASGAMGGECAAGSGADSIDFAIPGGGPHVISPGSSLPPIFGDLIVDASTQSGTDCAAGTLQVQLDGGSAGSLTTGFDLAGFNIQISGFAISNWDGPGIIGGALGGILITCNFIGTDISGSTAAPNLDGIAFDQAINLSIGDGTPAGRNLLSGNTFAGAFLENSGNRGSDTRGPSSVMVRGNMIGTNLAGTSPVPNGVGVEIVDAVGVDVGGPTPADGNLISGNLSSGVRIVGVIQSQFTIVANNMIGTNAAGTGALGNGIGVELMFASENTIGFPGAGNVISGNFTDGIAVQGGFNQFIFDNHIGTDFGGTTLIPNLGNGIYADGSGTMVIGDCAQGNLISGNQGNGILLSSSSTTIDIWSNLIGTNGTQSSIIPNALAGVRIEDSSENGIGGPMGCQGNVIAGSGGSAVELINSSTITTMNNFIGVNSALTPLGNGMHGIDIDGDASDVIANVIGANALHGIRVNNVVGFPVNIESNSIGTDPTGSMPLPNGGSGIDVAASNNVTIGGTMMVTGPSTSSAPADHRAPDPLGNNISFNLIDGVRVDGAGSVANLDNNRIENNVGNGLQFSNDAAGIVDGNCFAQNDNGLLTSASIPLIAENNWWGHPTGPSGGEPGFGDAVVGNIDAVPFIGTAPADCITLTPANSGFSPMSVDFGMVPVGMPTPNTSITLTNLGSVPMEIVSIDNGIPRGPAAFAVINVDCPIFPMELPPGGSCQIDANFTPPSTGMFSGSVRVTNNSQAGDEFVPLMGEGTMADADVLVTGTDSMDPIGAGEQLVYSLTATNLGPDPAVMAGVLFFLPPEVTYVSNDCGQPPPQQQGTFDWFIGDMNAPFPANFSCNITVDVDPFASGIITATADISSLTGDSNPSNNVFFIDTEVVQEADLFITKTDGQGSYEPGDTLTYTIVVGNNGPTTAFGANVVDQFAPEFDSVSWTCLPTRGISNCLTTSGTGDIDVLVDLIPGTTVTILATAQVSSSAAADPLVNTATVDLDPQGLVIDPDLSNNSATDSNSLGGSLADLSVTKTDGQNSYVPGETLTYTIRVDNLGPGEVLGATLQDIFAPEFDSVSWSCGGSPGSVCGQGAGNGNIQLSMDIPAGGFILVDAQADVSINATADPLVNSALASVPPGIDDPDLSNNAGSDFNSLDATQVDLSITKTDDSDLVSPGDVVSYTITVSNAGPDAATDARVSDFFPTSLNDVSWTCNAQSGASCPAAGDGDIDHLVNVPMGGMLTYTTTAVLANDAGGVLINTADVTPDAGTVELNPDDNSATDNTTIDGSVDLVLTKVAGVDPAIAGANLPYLLTIQNVGGDPATGVVLSDELPDEVSFLSAEPGQGSCDHADGTVTCQIGEVPGTQSVVVVLNVQVAGDATGSLTNSAGVASDEPDANPDDNQVTVVTEVLSELLLLPEDSELPNATNGEPYQVMFQTVGGVAPISLESDGDIPGLTFEQLPNMPVLMLSGTPTDPGQYSFTVSATDSDDPQAMVSREYQLTVVGGLALTPTDLVTAVVGVPYSVIFDSPDGVAPLSFAIDVPPPGMELIGDMLTGTPTTAGAFEFGAVVMDANGSSGSRDYLFTVVDDVQIIETPLPIGAVSLPYQTVVSAIGGVPPLNWSASGLPGGLSMSAGGTISGIPGSVSVSTVTVSVVDANGADDSADFELIIAQDALVNLTPPFPNGVVGFDYLAPIIATGGQPPYQCQLAGGQLPPGLSVNGCQISGEPTLAGSFGFTIQIADSAPNAAQLQFPGSIRIVNDTVVPIGGNPILPINPPIDTTVPPNGDGSPGSGFPDESLQSVVVDAFGFRYLAGYSYNGTDYDVRVLKYGPSGDLIWNTALDSGNQDYAYSITVNPADQTLSVAGYRLVGASYVAVLQRLTTTGQLDWEVINDGGIQVDAWYDVAADRSGVYLAGERFNGSNFDVLVAKYAHGGALLWESVLSRNETESGYALALDICDDSGIACNLFAGGQSGRDGDRGWISSYDPFTGARGNAQDINAHSVVSLTTLDGDLIAGGNTAGEDWGLSRLSFALANQWTSMYSDGDRFRSLVLDREGFVYAGGRGAGDNGQDGLIALFNPDSGALIDDFRYDDGASESFNGLALTPINELIAAGQSSGDDGITFLLLTIDTGKVFQ